MPHREHPPNGQLAAMILEHFPSDHHGWVIDIGASDGVSINTTYVMEKHHRWTALCVEPNPQFWPRLREIRAFCAWCAVDEKPGSEVPFQIHLENPEAYSALRPSHPEHPVGAGWAEIRVPVKTIDQVLDEAEFPQLDVLCIDIEGTEVDALRGCDLERWKPRVIVAEAWADRIAALDQYLAEKNYQPFRQFIDNRLYKRKPDEQGSPAAGGH